MKKILTMTVVVLTAALVQAGSFAWDVAAFSLYHMGSTGMMDKNFTGSDLIFLILTDSTGSNFDAITKEINDGKFLSSETIMASGYAGGGFGQMPQVLVSQPNDVLEPGSQVYVRVLIFDATYTGANGEKGYYQISDTVSFNPVLVGSLGSDENLITFGSGAFDSGNWKPYEIVPEPASALLGLAGIGLLIAQKRKRA